MTAEPAPGGGVRWWKPAILRPEESDEIAAVGLLERYADQAASFTDCVSFAPMRRHRIPRAFTFDRRFAAAGFEAWP